MKESIGLKVSVDFAGMKWTMREVVERTKLSIEGCVLTGARVVCTSHAPAGGQGHTWPKNYASGATATAGDISKHYRTSGYIVDLIQDLGGEQNEKAAKGFSKAMKSGKFSEGFDIANRIVPGAAALLNNWDGGRSHQVAHRGSKRGRIQRREPGMIILGSTQDGRSKLNSYIKFISGVNVDAKGKFQVGDAGGRIGMTQRGWYVALKKCVNVKGRGGANTIHNEETDKEVRAFPKWIVNKTGKPHTDNGDAYPSGSEWDRTWTVKNTTPWASEVMGENAKKFIMNVAHQRMKRYLIKTLKETPGLKKYA